MPRRMLNLFRNLFRQEGVEKLLDEELCSSLEILAQEKIQEGMDPREARRQARIELGGMEQVKMKVREARFGTALETVWQDIRYGLRMLRKNPGFTAIVILSLALGLGATTTIFGVLNGVLLRPLPYENEDRLALFWYRATKTERGTFPWMAPPDVSDFRAQSELFEAFATASNGNVHLTADGRTEQLESPNISANIFSVLGVELAIGRTFTLEEELPNGPNVVILSYATWQRRFAGDPGIVGRMIILDGEPHVMVGVTPRNFRLYLPAAAGMPENPDLWLPLQMDYAAASRWVRWVRVVGLRKQDASWEQAQAEMDVISHRLRREHSDYETAGLELEVHPLRDDVFRTVRPFLFILSGIVSLLFLISCSNVANFFLLRSSERRKEFAVRAALGASRSRMIRQLLMEGLLVSLISGALGLLLSNAVLEFIKFVQPPNLPRLDSIQVDSAVLAFTLGVSLVTPCLFVLLPAIQLSTSNLEMMLREISGQRAATGKRAFFGDMPVVTALAMSLVILIGCALMLQTAARLNQAPLGFATNDLLTFQLDLKGDPYDNNPERVLQFYDELAAGLTSLPGVEDVGAISHLPLGGGVWNGPYVDGEKHPGTNWNEYSQDADKRIVSVRFFETVDAQLIKGKLFSGVDRLGAPRVVIVDEWLAEKNWPGENPIGKRLKTTAPTPAGYQPFVFEVVGVVQHLHLHDIRRRVREQIYFSQLQVLEDDMSVAVRASIPPELLIAAIQSVVRKLNPSIPLSQVRTMESYLADATTETRFTLALLSILALLAVSLSGVGLYAVVARSVARRTREIGLRMALGAQAADVLRLIMRRGMELTLIGVGLGLVAAFVLTRFLSRLLFEVNATDPITFVVIPLVLVGVALLACYVPARRATRVDPMVALRYE